MSLSAEERQALVKLEMEKAMKTYAEAEALMKGEFWNGVASRLYYAVFHAVSALLVHDKHQVNTHRGVHTMFALHYIRTNALPTQYGKLFNQLQTMREESDYNCIYDVDPDELAAKMQPTKQLILDIGEMIQKQ